MLKKLLVLATAVGMLVGMASTAYAGFFLPFRSDLAVQLGALPTITVTGAYPGDATLTDNGSSFDLSDTAGIWVADGVSVVTALLTGVALLDRLALTGQNDAGAFTASFTAANPLGGNLTGASATPYSGTLCPNGCIGGIETWSGNAILGVGALNIPFPLSVVGTGGVASLPVGTAAIVATGAPFITGKVRITNITTNIVQIPGRPGVPTGVGVTLAPEGTELVRTFTTAGGFRTSNPANPVQTLGTVTLGGSQVLASASNAGFVTAISPLRINTGALGAGTIPGFFSKQFVFFVPEPGTVLLLVSGAAGLVFLGRRRMKR